MGHGFRQSSGRDQGGNPWHDDNVDDWGVPINRPHHDPVVDEYAKILHQVPISLMITILKRFGYKVISPLEEE